jgi:hypothetical protein
MVASRHPLRKDFPKFAPLRELGPPKIFVLLNRSSHRKIIRYFFVQLPKKLTSMQKKSDQEHREVQERAFFVIFHVKSHYSPNYLAYRLEISHKYSSYVLDAH